MRGRQRARPEACGICKDVTGRAAYLVGWTKPLRRASDYRKSSLRATEEEVVGQDIERLCLSVG